MLFNSYEFIFVFFPATLLGFFLLGRRSRVLALRWLIAASLFFYTWWRPINVLLIAPSILVNFALARAIQKASAREAPRLARSLLIVGIAFNVAFLGYFKYVNFLVGAVDDVFGTNYVIAKVILPLGISFITFQKIAFLVDVSSRRVESFTLQDYCLFVLFFPQLIAGPIVHYREVMPQFQRANCSFDQNNVAIGLTLFAFGLCKKAFLADGISPLVGTIFGQAAAGEAVSLFSAWLAVVGFTLQLYFDFSGYTDMAIGIARCFGIRLPANFNSPLRSSSIIEFWLRWHITLTRFLTAYIYNPLTLWLTRRRLAKGLKGIGGNNTTLGGFLAVLAFPTLVTMSISGLWHGAGYTFIVWGLLHGAYLTINHWWHWVARGFRKNSAAYQRVMRPAGFVLTFAAVAVGMAYFRAPNMATAGNLLRGLFGLHGVSLPTSIIHKLGHVGLWLHQAGVSEGPADDTFRIMARWVAGLSLLAFFSPNTMQLLSRFEPALGFDTGAPDRAGSRPLLSWQASAAWAVLVGGATVLGVLHLGGVSEFLYWQF